MWYVLEILCFCFHGDIMDLYDSEIQDFVTASHRIAVHGLVKCSSGNLSCRISPDIALLSVSRSWLGELTAEQVAVCKISTGNCINDKKPTCESLFHLGILKNRPQTNVVLHFQSPYATAIACGMPETIDYNTTIEVPVYIGTPAVVEYYPPGSNPLAQAVIDVFEDTQTHLAILKNHGLVTVGSDFNEAIQRAIFFEMTCQILLTNPDTKPLNPQAVKYLRGLGQA